MYKFIVMFFVGLMIFGCSQPVQDNENTPIKDIAYEKGITREFSQATVAAGSEMTVTLHIELEEGQTYYLFEEVIPSEFEATDKEPDKSNHLKVVKMQGAATTDYQYNLHVPTTPGTYTFSGEYAVDGMKEPKTIMGATQIIVQ